MAEFDAFARSYQNLVSESVRISGEPSDYFATYKALYLRRVLADLTVKRILDYGCGVGSLARKLRAQFPLARIDGFDPSAESIRRVDDSLRRQGTFVTSVEDLDTGYDLIVLANVLHHVKPMERQTVIGQVFSLLATDGRLTIFEHNPFNPLTRWAVSQCEFDADAILLKTSETCERLRMAGFRLLHQDFVVFFPRWLAMLRPLEPVLNWCPAGAQYAVLGVKAAV